MNEKIDKGPLVSLIVPVFNGDAYIGNLLDDVLAQTYCAFEVIVVDDSSDDGTVGIVEGVAGCDPRFRLVRLAHHRGASAARNAGLAHCGGSFVGFLDADDRIEPRYVEMLVDAAVRERASLVVCGWDRGEGSEAMLPQVGAGCAVRSLIEDKGFYSSLWNKLFAKDAVFSGSIYVAFDELLEIGEDEEWLARVLLGCDRFVVVPRVLYHWLPRGGSATSDTESLNARTMTEVRAKRLVYHHFSQRGDLHPLARRRYVWRMRSLLVGGYRAHGDRSSLYCELLSEFMAATEKISGGGVGSSQGEAHRGSRLPQCTSEARRMG